MRVRLTPFLYALLYAGVTLILYQRALMGYVLANIDVGTRDGLAVLTGAILGLIWVAMLAYVLIFLGTEGLDLIKETIRSLI